MPPHPRTCLALIPVLFFFGSSVWLAGRHGQWRDPFGFGPRRPAVVARTGGRATVPLLLHQSPYIARAGGYVRALKVGDFRGDTCLPGGQAACRIPVAAWRHLSWAQATPAPGDPQSTLAVCRSQLVNPVNVKKNITLNISTHTWSTK